MGTRILSKIFKSNRSQAVRLPKEIAFSDSVKEVRITSVGNNLIITPIEKSWESWFDSAGVSDDFMLERRQPEDQFRKDL